MKALVFDGFKIDPNEVHARARVEDLLRIYDNLTIAIDGTFGATVPPESLVYVLQLLTRGAIYVEDETKVGAIYFADDDTSVCALYDKPSETLWLANSSPKPGFREGFAEFTEATVEFAIENNWKGVLLFMFTEIIRVGKENPVIHVDEKTMLPSKIAEAVEDMLDEGNVHQVEVDGQVVNFVTVDLDGNPVELTPEMTAIHEEITKNLIKNGVVEKEKLDNLTDLARAAQQRIRGRLN